MKRKTSFFLVIILLAIACKKDKQPKADITLELVGTWPLYSTKSDLFLNDTAAKTSVQYPCLANNIITLNADSTGTTTYVGKDTCYIRHQTSVGIPGQLSQSYTWSLKGNYIYFKYGGFTIKNPGVISTNNGKLQITFRDTITQQLSQPTYFITVNIKN